MTKSKSPKSDAKRPSKKSATKRTPAPKKAPKAPAAKPSKKAATKKPRGRTAVFEAPREPESVPVPTIDTPPVAPAAPTLPAPPENTTRLSLSAAQWTALDDDGRARLAAPESGAVIGWTERDGRFIADVPDDLVSLVRATGDELVVHFDDDTLDLGEKTEEPEAL